MMAPITNSWVLLLLIPFPQLRCHYLYGGDVSAYNHPYHRSWTSWSSWSHCSRTCGGGIVMRTRVCRRRAVSSGIEKNSFCPGDTTEYRVCNTEECPKDSVNFLQYQCSLFNNRLISKRYVKEWIPYEKGENKCELRCQERGSGSYYSFGKVSDGTECSNGEGSGDICVNGRCLTVGCDGKVGSDAHLDICGVCGGRNNSCVYYRNMYLGQPMEPGYQEIAVIPVGSTHLEIRDVSHRNRLALTDSRYHYVINGPGTFSHPGEYHVRGNVVSYNRLLGNMETITASGPINQQLHIVALLHDRNPGIYYEYWAPKNKNYHIPITMKNFSRFSVFKNENRHINGDERLLERSKYDENSNPIQSAEDTMLRSKSLLAEGKVTANSITYHKYQGIYVHNKKSQTRRNNNNKYQLDDHRNKKWNDVSIDIVDKSGQNIPLVNRYTAVSPAANNSDCVLCNKRILGRCKPCKKIKNLSKHFCTSDFVVRGIVINKEKLQGKFRYVLQVIQSFKNSIPMQSQEYIWTRGRCACPKLRVDREYILMGHSDHSRRENRLLIDRKCYIRRYTRHKSLQLMRVKRNGCSNVT